MTTSDLLTSRFELSRPRLTSLAYRILGNSADADDAVQDAWLRLSRPGATELGEIANPAAWFTTVVSRVCLNKLRTRAGRREDTAGASVPEFAVRGADDTGPEVRALLAEQIGLALHIVLQTLSPAERLAFVLHDSFGLPFAEIAEVLERSVPATRKLASRARARVRAVDPTAIETDPQRQRTVVDAFFAASQAGDFGTLLALLHRDVVFHAEGGVTRPAAAATIRGRDQVAARAAAFAIPDATLQPVTVNGAAAVVVRVGADPVAVMAFVVASGEIVRILSLLDRPVVRRLAEPLSRPAGPDDQSGRSASMR